MMLKVALHYHVVNDLSEVDFYIAEVQDESCSACCFLFCLCV